MTHDVQHVVAHIYIESHTHHVVALQLARHGAGLRAGGSAARAAFRRGSAVASRAAPRESTRRAPCSDPGAAPRAWRRGPDRRLFASSPLRSCCRRPPNHRASQRVRRRSPRPTWPRGAAESAFSVDTPLKGSGVTSCKLARLWSLVGTPTGAQQPFSSPALHAHAARRLPTHALFSGRFGTRRALCGPAENGTMMKMYLT